MKSRPIIFSAPMVRAILKGRKTQTRRIVKLNPRHHIEERDDGTPWPWMYDGERDADYWVPCPYGQPGDQLWVREAWADLTVTHGQRWERFNKESGLYERGRHPFVWYRADGDQPDTGGGDLNPERWRPSIHMPRWASRITLEIVSVRVERLQDISEADAKAEGISCNDVIVGCYYANGHIEEHADRFFFDGCDDEGYETAGDAYAALLESINGTGSWAANSWVWVVEFKRIDQ